jgi:hypothetical protein
MADKMLSANQVKSYCDERKKMASEMLMSDSITTRALAKHSINWANDILRNINEGLFDWEDELE